MFDPITRGYLSGFFQKPLLSMWRLLRLMSIDGNDERRGMFRNLVCSLPSPYREEYLREIEWVVKQGRETSLFLPYDELGERMLPSGAIDHKRRMVYVNHAHRKLYFPGRDLQAVLNAYSSLVNDEGITGHGVRSKSPHSYVTQDFDVESGDVLLDVGCAEALFALDKIDVVRRAYLFEGLREWQKPLRATFLPYKDKTTLVFGYVGDGRNGTKRLQELVRESGDVRYFVKMDIEGAERSVLRASEEFMRSNKVRLSCCVYHRQDDAEVISDMLIKWGYSVSFSSGWTLPDCNGIHFPYFRHGVIRALNF